MFEKIRERIFYSLLPPSLKSGAIHPFHLSSFCMSDQPVYTDMTVRKAVQEGYKLSIYVYRAVRTIVQTGSVIPWTVEKDGQPLPDHEFTRTWARPNTEFSGQDNMEYIIAHLKLVGNALIQPVMVGGRPREFWLCMPDMIKPVPSKKPGQWLERWEITTTEGRKEAAPPDRFIHFMQFDPGNPYWGIGDLQAAARTIDTDNEAQDTQKVQLQNRNIPPGVFQFVNALTDEQHEEAVRRVREKFLQKSKRGEPWVLGGGYKWEQMAITPHEMDYILSRLQNLRAIAAAFGLDPWWLGDREHSTYNNVAEARRALYEDNVIPLLDDIRATLNLRVAPLYGDDIYINYDISKVTALRDDFGKKTEQAQKLWSMGVPFEQVNEKLELGFEEFNGWDISYLPYNLAPNGAMVISRETVGEKIYTKALNLDTEEQKSAYWKRVDSRREAWAGVVQKKLAELYEAEGEAVLKAMRGKDPEDMAAAAVQAINERRAEWEKMLSAAMVIAEDFGNNTAIDLGEGWRFDSLKAGIREWAAAHAADAVKSILATNLKDIRRIILKAIAGEISAELVVRRIRQLYKDLSQTKAERAARTEVAAASGYGQRQAALQSGFVKTHTWLTSRDDRVRDSHAALEGQMRPLNEKFSNGLLYPGDTAGEASDVVQCRCVEGYGT